MNLFKRLEVLLLLVLAVGVAVWALVRQDTSAGLDGVDPAEHLSDLNPERPASGASTIHRSTLERDYGNARLDIDLMVVNPAETKLVMRPPHVKLLTNAGREVPPFFLPFDPPVEIRAATSEDVRLRYWLDAADLKGGLTLLVGGERIAVKSSAPFELEKLKNKEPRVYSYVEWSL